MCKLITGVPQGFILGPLLFILYINDLPNISSKLKITCFADDTTLLYSDESIKYSLSSAQTELKLVFDWFLVNRLCVNINKTYFMLFASRNQHCSEYKQLGNHIIKRIRSTKFLGVHIDDQLSWSVHNNELKTTLSKCVGILKLALHCLPRDVLLSIFYALFYKSH
jgi:hypothetical protein